MLRFVCSARHAELLKYEISRCVCSFGSDVVCQASSRRKHWSVLIRGKKDVIEWFGTGFTDMTGKLLKLFRSHSCRQVASTGLINSVTRLVWLYWNTCSLKNRNSALASGMFPLFADVTWKSEFLWVFMFVKEYRIINSINLTTLGIIFCIIPNLVQITSVSLLDP